MLLLHLSNQSIFLCHFVTFTLPLCLDLHDLLLQLINLFLLCPMLGLTSLQLLTFAIKLCLELLGFSLELVDLLCILYTLLNLQTQLSFKLLDLTLKPCFVDLIVLVFLDDKSAQVFLSLRVLRFKSVVVAFQVGYHLVFLRYLIVQG